MSFFGLGKKNADTCGLNSEIQTTCSCNGSCSSNDTAGTRFLVLGACCKKSEDTFANVKQAVHELGLTDEVANIGDALEIAKYGVMQTPAFVIDNKVVSYGRLLNVEDAKTFIKNAGI